MRVANPDQGTAVPTSKPTSVLAADPATGVPHFVTVHWLAAALGRTRHCIYLRAKRGALPPFDSIALARGWFATTLDEQAPDLMNLVRSFLAAQMAK